MKSLVVLFTLGLILSFAANCMPTADIEPANSDVFDVATIEVRPSATSTPFLETPTPPPTPTHTPTPNPTVLTTTPWPPDPVPSPTPVPPFPGMVYTTDEGLWRVNADWQPELLFDQWGVLEPNGRRILYRQDDDIWLADLDTGTRQNLTNTPDIHECCSQWWPNQPDKILVLGDEFYHNYTLGQMIAVTLEGNYQVLVEDNSDTLPAISPDGQTIAFEINGKPALYHQNGEIEWLTLQPPDMPAVLRIGNPVWSADGQKLAWEAYFNDDEGQISIAVLIYQIATSDIDVIHPYHPAGHDYYSGRGPVWQTDGTFITLFAIDQDGSGWGLWVLGTNNDFEINLGDIRYSMWSPDGRYLLYQNRTGGDTYLTYPPGFTDKIRITLPPGATVIDWQAVP